MTQERPRWRWRRGEIVRPGPALGAECGFSHFRGGRLGTGWPGDGRWWLSGNPRLSRRAARHQDGDDEEERICWGDVLKEKKVAQGKVRIEVVAPSGKQWVHVRVEDADTGQPVGTRVHFRSEHGAYLAPHGHQADVNVAWFEDMGGDCKTGGVPYAYIDGTCQIDLPSAQCTPKWCAVLSTSRCASKLRSSPDSGR